MKRKENIVGNYLINSFKIIQFKKMYQNCIRSGTILKNLEELKEFVVIYFKLMSGHLFFVKNIILVQILNIYFGKYNKIMS